MGVNEVLVPTRRRAFRSPASRPSTEKGRESARKIVVQVACQKGFCVRSLGFVLFVGLVVAPLTASAQDERVWLEKRDLYEEWLSTSEIQGLEDVGEGVTEPMKVTLEQGDTVFYAIYKPIKRGRHRGYWESYQAEVAAYELDKLLELDMVPPTVVRRIKGDLGSLQLWVPDCDTYKRLEAKVPQSPGFSQQISRMKMFDNLIFNDDRNAGNFLLDESWNVVLIDHSRAFLDRKNLLKGDHKLPAQYDRKLVERLRALNAEALEAAFDGLLQGRDIDAMLARRDKLLEHHQELVDARGAAALFN